MTVKCFDYLQERILYHLLQWNETEPPSGLQTSVKEASDKKNQADSL